MQNDIEEQTKSRGNGKVIAGFILLVVGGVLLLQQVGGYMFPSWLFEWPMILIIVGFYSGARHNFRNPTSYIMIVIGTIFLLDDIFPGVNLSNLFWPVIIISVGIMMILGRNHKWDKSRFKRDRRWNSNRNWDKHWDWDKQVNPENPEDPTAPASDSVNPKYSQSKTGYTSTGHLSEDQLEAISIFGSANKTILSKNFKGGEIVNIFGGAEIDFTQADINGRVVIDVTQVFGGIKLLVPPHWHVTSDMVALFAGFDDKRKQRTDITTDKVLVITGTSIFAGIEVRSY
jgi:predicted membrane protein